jgi:hypothetical protein
MEKYQTENFNSKGKARPLSCLHGQSPESYLDCAHHVRGKITLRNLRCKNANPFAIPSTSWKGFWKG